VKGDQFLDPGNREGLGGLFLLSQGEWGVTPASQPTRRVLVAPGGMRVLSFQGGPVKEKQSPSTKLFQKLRRS